MKEESLAAQVEAVCYVNTRTTLAERIFIEKIILVYDVVLSCLLADISRMRTKLQRLISISN